MVRSLQLHELLGATLIAIVRADAEAAKATLEFIQTVGFVTPESEGDETETDLQAGQLRMAEFRYRKLDENNEISEFVASVPVLSLVPIPGLQIKDAKLSLAVKLSDIVAETPSPKTSTGQPTTLQPQPSSPQPTALRNPFLSRLRPVPYKLLAKPAATSGTKTQEMKGTFHVDIQVSLQQADIPLGLEKILELMDQSIRDQKTSNSEARS
jgi:hypothetical protein